MEIRTSRGRHWAPRPDAVDSYTATIEKRLFRDNTSLLVNNEKEILRTSRYFFSPLSFAYCALGSPGMPYFSAAFRLGHLIWGWRRRTLCDQCSTCGGRVFVTAFGGNVKDAQCWLYGLCMDCFEWCRSSSSKSTTKQRADTMRRIVRRTPDLIEQVEMFAGYEFAWSGDGLRATHRSRLVTVKQEAVAFDALVYELQSEHVNG